MMIIAQCVVPQPCVLQRSRNIPNDCIEIVDHRRHILTIVIHIVVRVRNERKLLEKGLGYAERRVDLCEKTVVSVLSAFLMFVPSLSWQKDRISA